MILWPFTPEDPDGLSIRAYTWLPGGFDARTLRRRLGWALRRYRGVHRSGAWDVYDVRAWVTASAEQTRRAHLRSLRRPPSIGGTIFRNVRFYGVMPPGDEPITVGALFAPADDGLLAVPALGGTTADDAVTGPIVL